MSKYNSDDFSYPHFSLDNSLMLVKANSCALKNAPEFCEPSYIKRRVHADRLLLNSFNETHLVTIICYDMPANMRTLLIFPFGDEFCAILTPSAFSGDYPTNFSEKFRTPITTIMSNIGIMSTSCDSPEVYENLKSINKSCYEMLRSAEMLELLSKVSQASFERQPIDLTSLFESIINATNSVSLNDCPKILFRSPQVPVYTMGNKQIISAMLENLIANSMKFTRDDNVITIVLKAIGDRIVVTVTDKGMGIRPEVLPYVFDVYYSASPYAEDKPTGQGLGLTFVKSAATALNGFVSISSVLHEGTTVGFTLANINLESTEIPLYSDASEYIANKFSSVYIQLNEFCKLPIYKSNLL